MATKFRLRPDHAHVPDALPFFLLLPGKPLRYSLWSRFWDRWAGRRDRTDATRTSGDDAPVADTPWLTRLVSECSNVITAERIRTEALVAVIDRERAELEARLHRAEAVATSSQAELQRISDAPIGDGIVGTGEQFSSPEERLQRRQLERAAAVSAQEGRIASANAEVLEINARLEVLTQERRSHWAVLRERVRNLVKHYRRRASTYVRAMERRRDGVTWQVPDIPCPDWALADLGAPTA
ncbi:hypothetical protein [Arachnia propionica]|uniref:Uncharacterized protein n=1 Tax=Arachnia propionica TaxID=1750 RepID=A0A3P1WR37_9ACTN|nr:hypothetical protein [Arachnia propionica]RRD48755.1 hypothetical protein EII35_11145 [Arachnia propionica]